MVARCLVTHSPEETVELGRGIAAQLKPPVAAFLIGDLGAGKTTLAKGLVSGLGVAAEDDVTSPTFTLVHEYGQESKDAPRVYHVDLYRIETPRALETVGLEDLLGEQAIVIVEWGEKLGPFFRRAWSGSGLLEIRLEVVSETERRIEIEAQPVPAPSV